MARNLMSDAEWAFFEEFIIAIRGRGGRPGYNHRLVLDGIFWIARTGAPWRDLPEEFGKWSSVYRQFRRWTLAGLWQLILEVLNESGAVPDGVQMIDSTIIRAHHHAAGAKGGLRSKVFGRSKGGFTTKIHLLANIRGLPIKAEISGGEVSDYKGFDMLMEENSRTPDVFIADKGYDSDTIRESIEQGDGVPVIPGRSNRKKQPPLDDFIYALRNLIERCFNKLKNARRLATRYDKTAASFLGFIEIVSVRLWFKSLST